MKLRTLRRFRTPHMAMIGAATILFVASVAALAQARAEKSIRIIAFGDSLMAGYRLPADGAFPRQLERALRRKGHAVEVVGAGVSGDTTETGLARLDWAVPDGADAVIVELGANDALRGIDPAVTRRNLDAIVTQLEKQGAEVLLAGMKAPRNWGEDYVREFESIYPELSRKHRLILYPFFLDGVALDPALVLDDGLHPNPRGVAKMVDGILPSVEKLIAKVEATRAASAR